MIKNRIGWSFLLGLAGFGFFVFTRSYVLTMPIIALAIMVSLEKNLLRAAELATAITGGFLIYWVISWSLYGLTRSYLKIDKMTYGLDQEVTDLTLAFLVAITCLVVTMICNRANKDTAIGLRNSKIKRYRRG